LCFIAIKAAIKKVLSPISETKIIEIAKRKEVKGVCFLTSCGLSGESGLAVTAVADIKGNNAKKTQMAFVL